jgi:hypothetical protein
MRKQNRTNEERKYETEKGIEKGRGYEVGRGEKEGKNKDKKEELLIFVPPNETVSSIII